RKIVLHRNQNLLAARLCRAFYLNADEHGVRRRFIPQRTLTIADDRHLLQHRAAMHESRSLLVICSQHRLQKVACSICAEKYPNRELLRRYAEGVGSKTSAMPQRAMTFLRNLFCRDICGSSDCHTKIHRAYPTTCFASFS